MFECFFIDDLSEGIEVFIFRTKNKIVLFIIYSIKIIIFALVNNIKDVE